MILVAVLSVVAGGLLLTTTMRYHTTYQSASWQESIVGAEAGIDLAMNELRKRVTQGAGAAFQNNWTIKSSSGTAYPDYGHAFPAGTQPYLLGTHGGEGNTALLARAYLDVPGSGAAPTYTQKNFAVAPPDPTSSFISQADNPTLRDPDNVDRSRWWYRIRALGVAGVSGPPQANLEKLDNRLRRFSFFTDWRTGQAVTTPEVARLVEVIVRPETNFRNALMADKQIDLGNQDVLIDSYDSGKGQYSTATNHGMMGNIATNGQLINASHATVSGDAMTNNGTVNDGDQVTGQQSSNFYQELPPLTSAMLNPAWNGVKDGGTITGTTTYTSSNDPTNPATVRLDGINLPAGGKTIALVPPSTGTSTSTTPGYIKIYVQGDINTAGNSYIDISPSVNAIFYVTGNVNLQGNGIINNSFLASHLVLNGIQPAANSDGTYPTRTITIASTQDFEGIVYAPNHDLTLALKATAASSSSDATGTLLQVRALEQSIAIDQQNIALLQADYNSEMAKYQSEGGDDGSGGNGHFKKAQQDLARITSLQAQIVSLTQQLQLLSGVNPASSNDDHAAGYNGIYGGFVGKTIKVGNKTHVHYDETLRQAGPVNHYEIVNWFEDNISRDATGGTELFWWRR